MADTAQDTAPDLDPRSLQLEGLGIAIVYTVSFLWVHLSQGHALISVKLVALFCGGLVLVPACIGLPLVLMRRAFAPRADTPGALAAITPFAGPALYGLQVLLVYLATTHAYQWLMAP